MSPPRAAIQSSATLAAITDNSATSRYLVVAPGTYTETATVTLKDYVDIVGSGQGVTTISCACGGGAEDVSPC
jgi:pectin methylesterase-like acyl-CoA thioesterase